MRRLHRNMQTRIRADGVEEVVEVESVNPELQEAIDNLEKEHQRVVAESEQNRLEKLKALGVAVNE